MLDTKSTSKDGPIRKEKDMFKSQENGCFGLYKVVFYFLDGHSNEESEPSRKISIDTTREQRHHRLLRNI